jgi:hypothetical protein
VAWTSDAKNRWGKDWLGWENYSRFWGGVVWRILREQPSNLRMSTEVEGDKGKIVVHAIADDGTPLSDLDLVAYITDPESKSLPRIRLRQTGVSTYEADFPAEKIGKYQVAVKKREGSSGPGAAAYGGASVPFSAEMEHLQEDEPFLNRLAEKGGGTYLDDGIRNQFDLFDRSQLSSAKDFQDLWKLLLAVAAILFPLDVFVRRVVIDYSEVFRKARQRYRASRGLPEKAEDEQMSRLKEAKRSAGKDRVTPDFISRQTEAGTAFELTREQQADLESQIVIQSDSQKEKPTTPPQPEESGSDNYTSRLLKAKKRARKDNK